MRVWIVTVTLIFALFQLYHWAKGVMLPLPIYILAGAFLAIASNYDRGISLLTDKTTSSLPQPLSQNATLIEPLNLLEPQNYEKDA